jgi:hypothetical protein
MPASGDRASVTRLASACWIPGGAVARDLGVDGHAQEAFGGREAFTRRKEASGRRGERTPAR